MSLRHESGKEGVGGDVKKALYERGDRRKVMERGKRETDRENGKGLTSDWTNATGLLGATL